MKIHIIGASGSGKSYLGKKISEAFNIPYVPLDELFWLNNGMYNKTRDEVERAELLNQALKQDQWVIEGVYYQWVEACFEQADVIILLKVPIEELKKRIWGRYHKRKRFEHHRTETKETVQALIHWLECQFMPNSLNEIEKILSDYDHKVIIATQADQAFNELLSMPVMIQERKEEYNDTCL